MIRKGDKFRLVDGFPTMRGKKYVCTGTAVEPVSRNGHNGITVIKFTAPDWEGKPARYAVPASWCAAEPANPGHRRRRLREIAGLEGK